MAESMKFAKIVEAARLVPSTAQYVLKGCRKPWLPGSGSQGIHRVFSLRQGVRFATVTKLVMAGVPLQRAEDAEEFCFAYRLQSRLRENERLYARDPRNGPWYLEMLDEDRIQLRRKKESPVFILERYYSIHERKEVDTMEDPTPHSRYILFLTELESSLAREMIGA